MFQKILGGSLLAIAATIMVVATTIFITQPKCVSAYACHYVRVCDGPGMSSCRLLWICE